MQMKVKKLAAILTAATVVAATWPAAMAFASQTGISNPGTFKYISDTPTPTPVPNTTPHLTNLAKKAVTDGLSTVTIRTALDVGFLDICPDTLKVVVESELNVLVQFGAEYAMLVPNAVFKAQGTDELIRLTMEKVDPTKAELQALTGSTSATGNSLSTLTTFEASLHQSGRTIESFGGQRITLVINMTTAKIAAAQKDSVTGYCLDKGVLLRGKWNSDKDFAFPTPYSGRFSVVVTAAPSTPLELRMSLGSTSYTINNERKTLPAPLDVVDGRVIVPLRFIAEEFGATVVWKESSKTAVVTLDGQTINVTDGVKLDGTDLTPVMVDGQLYVPVRFIAEGLGCEVAWTEATGTLVIKK